MGRKRGKRGQHEGDHQTTPGNHLTDASTGCGRPSNHAGNGGSGAESQELEGSPAAVAMRVPIEHIKFSQKSCSEQFKGETRTIWETADGLGAGTRRRDLPMVKAYEKEGEYHSLDHRRLAALKIACQRGAIGKTIKADILENAQAAREYERKNSTTNDGDRMRVTGTGVDVDVKGNLWSGETCITTQRGWRPNSGRQHPQTSGPSSADSSWSRATTAPNSESLVKEFVTKARDGDICGVRGMLGCIRNLDARYEGYDGGKNALIGAAFHGHDQVVRLLLSHHADANATDQLEQTALMMADEETCRYITFFPGALGLDPDWSSGKSVATVVSVTPDGQADRHGVQCGWLMRFIDDLEHPCTEQALKMHAEGSRPYSVVFNIRPQARQAQDIIVELLLAGNADVLAADCCGLTAFAQAAGRGHKRVVQRLLASRAEFDTRDSTGATALTSAATNGHIAVVHMLLACRACVNTQTDHGMTPLHLAIVHSHSEVVRMLLTSTASLLLRTDTGDTAYVEARLAGTPQIREMVDDHVRVLAAVAGKSLSQWLSSSLPPSVPSAAAKQRHDECSEYVKRLKAAGKIQWTPTIDLTGRRVMNHNLICCTVVGPQERQDCWTVVKDDSETSMLYTQYLSQEVGDCWCLIDC